MATLSLAGTPQPTNVPPRVQVDVTDAGTPSISSVTVTRTDNSGKVSIVRTPDGGPLSLTVSGSNRAGTVYDYEAPYGVPVSYSTVEQPANQSAEVTLSVADPWLVHPGVPDRSMPVDFAIGSFDEEEWAVTSGVFRPLGRRNAVVVTDGQRKSGTGSFTLAVESLAEFDALRSLVDDAGVLLLNVPPALGLGLDSAYIAILNMTPKRRSSIGSDPGRNVACPYVVVDAPVGGSQAQYQWADVMATYSSWTALRTANATWADVLAPTT